MERNSSERLFDIIFHVETIKNVLGNGMKVGR
jgi:hypothetical protein